MGNSASSFLCPPTINDHFDESRGVTSCFCTEESSSFGHFPDELYEDEDEDELPPDIMTSAAPTRGIRPPRHYVAEDDAASEDEHCGESAWRRPLPSPSSAPLTFPRYARDASSTLREARGAPRSEARVAPRAPRAPYCGDAPSSPGRCDAPCP